MPPVEAARCTEKSRGREAVEGSVEGGAEGGPNRGPITRGGEQGRGAGRVRRGGRCARGGALGAAASGCVAGEGRGRECYFGGGAFPRPPPAVRPSQHGQSVWGWVRAGAADGRGEERQGVQGTAPRRTRGDSVAGPVRVLLAVLVGDPLVVPRHTLRTPPSLLLRRAALGRSLTRRRASVFLRRTP